MSYKQLNEEQRYLISALSSVGYKQVQIAKEVGVTPSTISREINRNKGLRGYRPKQANEKAVTRRIEAYKQIKMKDNLLVEIESCIRKDWSPEQISGFLRKNNEVWVSHETIYQYIFTDKKAGGDLYKHLRHANKKYRKRYGSTDRRGQINNRVSIDERPAIVDKRRRIGDWEADLIVGKGNKKAIISIVERTSLKTILKKVEGKEASDIASKIKALLKPYKGIALHTMTTDNGKEFSHHEDIAKALNLDFYFAHPYSSWERGTNENTNGLVRQYIPKGSDFSQFSDSYIHQIEDNINTRPRKCLGYQTANEFFSKMLET